MIPGPHVTEKLQNVHTSTSTLIHKYMHTARQTNRHIADVHPFVYSNLLPHD